MNIHFTSQISTLGGHDLFKTHLILIKCGQYVLYKNIGKLH